MVFIGIVTGLIYLETSLGLISKNISWGDEMFLAIINGYIGADMACLITKNK